MIKAITIVIVVTMEIKIPKMIAAMKKVTKKDIQIWQILSNKYIKKQ